MSTLTTSTLAVHSLAPLVTSPFTVTITCAQLRVSARQRRALRLVRDHLGVPLHDARPAQLRRPRAAARRCHVGAQLRRAHPRYSGLRFTSFTSVSRSSSLRPHGVNFTLCRKPRKSSNSATSSPGCSASTACFWRTRLWFR